MNKQEWLNDLISLQSQKKNIEGAINYIISKIQEIDRLEQIKLKEDKKKEEKKDEE